MAKLPTIHLDARQGGGRYRDVVEFVSKMAREDGVSVAYALAMQVRRSPDYLKWATEKRKAKA